MDTSKLIKHTLVAGTVRMERPYLSRSPITIGVTPAPEGALLDLGIEDRHSRKSVVFFLTKEELGQFAEFFSFIQNAL
jgi:hypothetical protein